MPRIRRSGGERGLLILALVSTLLALLALFENGALSFATGGSYSSSLNPRTGAQPVKGQAVRPAEAATTKPATLHAMPLGLLAAVALSAAASSRARARRMKVARAAEPVPAEAAPAIPAPAFDEPMSKLLQRDDLGFGPLKFLEGPTRALLSMDDQTHAMFENILFGVIAVYTAFWGYANFTAWSENQKKEERERKIKIAQALNPEGWREQVLDELETEALSPTDRVKKVLKSEVGAKPRKFGSRDGFELTPDLQVSQKVKVQTKGKGKVRGVRKTNALDELDMLENQPPKLS